MFITHAYLNTVITKLKNGSNVMPSINCASRLGLIFKVVANCIHWFYSMLTLYKQPFYRLHENKIANKYGSNMKELWKEYLLNKSYISTAHFIVREYMEKF